MSAVLSDAREAMDERFQKALRIVRQDICNAFNQRANLRMVTVPYVNGSGRVVYQSIAEAATDAITDGEPQEAFMAVLAGSDCPLVQKLRDALVKDYTYLHADEVAEVWA